MMQINEFFIFLSIWSIQIAAAAIMASIACWLLRKSPGNIHAAIWIAVLIFAWIVPFSPLMVPEPSKIPIYRPTIDRVNITGSSSSDMNHFKTSGRERPRVSSNRLKRSVVPQLSRSDLRNHNRYEAVPVQEKKSSSQMIQWTALFKLALLVVWLAGMMAFAVRWIRLKDRIGNILRIAREIEDPCIIETVERTRQLLFLEGPIRILTADALVAPFVMGLRKPILFLPSTVVKTWSPREIQAVVGHELGHLRRYDLFVHTAMQSLRAVFWFWPPVWWMQRELHRAQDAACDECAAVVLGSGLHFGEALARLAEHCLIKDCAFPALGIVHTRHALIKRLENIMNQKIVRLTRISLRRKLSLTVVSILLFGLCGIFSQTVASQSLDLKFLGNYPDYAVEGFVYAPPYYAAISSENGKRFAFFYDWKNGQWVEISRIEQPVQMGDEVARTTVANDVHTVFVYEDSAGIVKVWAIKHSDVDITLSATFNLPENGVYKGVRLSGEYLYFLIEFPEERIVGDNVYNYKGQYVYRYSLLDAYHTVKSELFFVPEEIRINAFEAFGHAILMVVEEQKSDGSDSWLDKSLAIGRFDSPRRLNVDPQRWFQVERSVVNQNDPRQLAVQGDRVVIGFETRDSATGNERYEYKVVDWVLENDPVVTQTIECSGLQSSYLWLAPDASWLGLHQTDAFDPENPTAGQDVYLDVYQWVDGSFQKKSKIDGINSLGAFGDRSLYCKDLRVYRFFDLTDPSNPLECSTPVVASPSINQFAVDQKFAYYLADPDDGEGSKLLSIDTAIPSSVRVVGEWALSHKIGAKINARDSLLAVYEYDSPRLDLFALDASGAIREKIASPQFPEGDIVTGIQYMFWTREILIVVASNENSTGQAQRMVYVFHRDNSGVGALLSNFEMDAKGINAIDFNGEYLCAYSWKTQIDDGMHNTHSVAIYSIANPSRPELAIDYEIKNESRSVMPYYMSVGSHYVLLSTMSDSCVLLDIADALHPKEFTFKTTELIRRFTWFDDLLVGQGVGSILFYRVDDDGQLRDIGRHSIPDRTFNLQFTPNRMFVSKVANGLDVYQLTISDLTEISSWTQF